MTTCIKCGNALSVYDVGFFKKMVCRGATQFACIPCTAKHFRISETQAWEMIRRFQQQGCTLFPAPTSDEPTQDAQT